MTLAANGSYTYDPETITRRSRTWRSAPTPTASATRPPTATATPRPPPSPSRSTSAAETVTAVADDASASDDGLAISGNVLTNDSPTATIRCRWSTAGATTQHARRHGDARRQRQLHLRPGDHHRLENLRGRHLHRQLQLHGHRRPRRHLDRHRHHHGQRRRPRPSRRLPTTPSASDDTAWRSAATC